MLIMWLTNPGRLSPRALKEITSPGNDIYVSVVSIWEIEIKVAIGKLPALPDFELRLDQVIALDRFEVLDFHRAHAHRVSLLPLLHRDPFDRALISQAISEKLELISSDRVFAQYPVSLVW